MTSPQPMKRRSPQAALGSNPAARTRTLVILSCLLCVAAGPAEAQGVHASGDLRESRISSWKGRLQDELVRRANFVGTLIEQNWPDSPEAVAMLADILKGSQLGPGEGWFKKGVARTRLDWNEIARRLDKDHDNRIDRGEFGGPDADFARLDRDHDGALSPSDFDFSTHALAPSPGAMVFYMADRDGNGKLTREEFDAFFRGADREGSGFLSLGDLQETLPMPNMSERSRGQSAGPSIMTLLKGLTRQEIGSLQPGIPLLAPAPDFTLKTVDGKKQVSLSREIGPRPVVLVFGNFTCGPFRSQAGNVEKLALRYRDRATFLMIYVREAHPTDGWEMASNNRVGVKLAQPRSYSERVEVAQMCDNRLKLSMPMLVDTMDDQVGARYSGMPSRLYLIDRRGRVAYRSGRGPFGFKPQELEHSLILLLRDEFPELRPAIGTPGEASSARRHDRSTLPPSAPPSRQESHPIRPASSDARSITSSADRG